MMAWRIPALLVALFLASIVVSPAEEATPAPATPATDPIVEKRKGLDKQFEKLYADAQLEFRKGFAELITSADRVEVFLLKVSIKDDSAGVIPGLIDPLTGKAPEPLFPGGAGSPKAKVLDHRILNENERKNVLAALQEAMGKQDGSVTMCHFPIHGLRIWRKDTVLYEGTFCWHCNNFSFNYSHQSTDWLNATPALEYAVNEVMPISAAERRRIEAIVSPKATPPPRKKGR